MTVSNENSVAQELTGIVGQHFIYTYANGWQYEMYVKNANTIDYRIHSGMVAGRWVKHQAVDLVQLAADVYKLSWTEPTGTSVCVNVMPGQRRLHGVIFFPKWVHEHPERTVGFQNEHLPEMERFRMEGPTYPNIRRPRVRHHLLHRVQGPERRGRHLLRPRSPSRWIRRPTQLRPRRRSQVSSKIDLASIATSSVGGGELDGGTQAKDPRFGRTAVAGIPLC